MKKTIELTDWSRILLGEVPLSFLIEAVIRSAFIYILLLTSMRLLGSRMASQMNVSDMTALVSLAAAVGIPLLSPDRGLLPAVVIALVIVSIGRLSAYLSSGNAKAESIIEGHVDTLVENGVLQLKRMKKSRVTRERLFARMRSQGFKHLGSLRRVYLESSGAFSIVPEQSPRAGLSLIPDWDEEFVREQHRSPVMVCRNCGAEKNDHADASGRCKNCGDENWIAATE
jgi:uncharacterized membrane protein YcaP (DUF421 family)